MLVILRIGYQKFVLPNEKGVATILRALSKAQEIKDDQRWNDGGIKLYQKAVDVSVEMMSPAWKFIKRKPDDALEPDEILPPIAGELGRGGRRSLPPPTPRQIGQGATALPRRRQLQIGGLS